MLDEFPPLTGICQGDVVIVGGGLTGLMTGAQLTAAGMRVILLDAGQLRLGASGLCTGAATVMTPQIYARIRRTWGAEIARAYAGDVQSALKSLPALLRGKAPFREAEAYAYALLPGDLPALEEQLTLCQSLGLPVRYAPDAGGCPFPVELSMMLGQQILLDVPPLLTALARRIRAGGGQVFGRTRITGIEPGCVHTATGRADAPRIILAAGKPPGLRRWPLLALLESRTMVCCHLQGALPLHTLQQSVREGGLRLTPTPGGMAASFCLGRTGNRETAERAELFRRILRARLPDLTAGPLRFRQEVFPLDGLPLVGPLPEYRGRVFCACGYSGWGLTGALLAAGVLTRQLLSRPESADALYRPDRRLPAKARLSLWHNLLAIRAANRLRRGPRCPHLNGTLRYHPPSRRWACPFCGSVFTMFGEPLAGPALRGRYISPSRRPEW